MALDNKSLYFNLDKTFNLFNLNAKQYDTDNARGFTFYLIQNGKPFDLTGISVTVGGIKSDGHNIFNNVIITDIINGIIQVNLTTQMLAKDGVLNLELILMKNSIRLSSYPFDVNIVPSVTNFNMIQSSDEFGALTEALGKVNSTITDVENKVNEAVNDLKSNSIGTVNLFDNTDFSTRITSFYESTASCQFMQDTEVQGQSSIFYPGKNIIGIQSYNNQFGDTYCTFIKTNNRVIQPNTTYTLSFWYMSLHSSGDISSSSLLYLNTNEDCTNGGFTIIPMDDLDLSSHGANWTRYTKTFTTPSNIKNIQLRLGFRCTAYAWMVVDGIKLERGNIATDWSLGNTDISNKLKKSSDINAPQSHDCNDFKTPELSFWWDTGIDGFKNTPLGFLPKNSARVFYVKNEGTDGRLIQTFKMVYPHYTNRTWTRCYNSDAGGVWSEWSTVFMGEKLISNGDDWNSFLDMGCYKVQGIDNSKNFPSTPNGATYGYGMLNVFKTGVKEENRTLQVYYPHQADTNGHRIVYYRMYNGTEWTAWDTLGGNVYQEELGINTKQIASNSSAISDIQHNWFSDCSNSLCINGFTSLKVYAQGVYYITGNSVTELQSIDHSELKNGQIIYFICETNDQTANIKFPASLSSSAVYTPKGADFWITGRDNGDTIYIMQKIGGALRFRSL